ncbi:unnamed protein product [Peniophora sp. CBMAI 1063]|nr:unnamed protein product [Peniophora sp. CBMAI 1063]
MASRQQRMPPLLRLPHEVILRIALCVIAMDLQPIQSQQFVPDEGVTTSIQHEPTTPACCCRGATGSWSHQVTCCFQDLPPAYLSAIAFFGSSKTIRETLLAAPAFWANIPVLQPTLLPDSLNWAGTAYPLEIVAPALCLCVLDMIIPRLRFAGQLCATFPSVHGDSGQPTSQILSRALLKSGAPKLRRISLKFNPYPHNTSTRLTAVHMPSLHIFRIANGLFVGYGKMLSELHIAFETFEREAVSWSLQDLIRILKFCPALNVLVLLNAFREASHAERRNWRTAPLHLDLPLLSLLLLRADFMATQDLFGILMPPAGCSVLVEVQTGSFPREAPSNGAELCAQSIANEVALSLKLLRPCIMTSRDRSQSASVASLEYRSGEPHIDRWPDYVRVTYATSIAGALAANDPQALAARNSFTLRNSWISHHTLSRADRSRTFGIPHTQVLQSFLRGSSNSELAYVRVVIIRVEGRYLWPDNAYEALFASAVSMEELVVLGVVADGRPYRNLLTYLNRTGGLKTRLRNVKFPDWKDNENIYFRTGELWNKRFGVPGRRAPITWAH